MAGFSRGGERGRLGGHSGNTGNSGLGGTHGNGSFKGIISSNKSKILPDLQPWGSDGCCSSLHNTWSDVSLGSGSGVVNGTVGLAGTHRLMLRSSAVQLRHRVSWRLAGLWVRWSGASGLHEADGEIRSVLNQHPLNKHSEILLWTALSRVALLAGPCWKEKKKRGGNIQKLPLYWSGLLSCCGYLYKWAHDEGEYWINSL